VPGPFKAPVASTQYRHSGTIPGTDLKGGFIRGEFLIHHNGYGQTQDPRPTTLLE